MSQTQWSVVLLGGRRSADGLFDFQRPVLLEPAVQHMLREIPPAWHCFYVHARTECELSETSVLCEEQMDRLQRLQCAEIPADSMVMLFDEPVPALTRTDYLRLAEEFSQTASDVLTIRDQNGVEVGVLCRADRVSEQREHDASLTEAAVTSMQRAYEAQRSIQMRTAQRLMGQGVSILDPNSTWVAADAVIGAGTSLLPGTMVYPGCRIGSFCTIGPNTVLKRAEIGDRTEINASQVLESSVGSDSSVGPYAYIRPGCTVGDRTRIGDFVELKNAVIGDDTKASHLTYVGDADVGANVNFGCGTVVVNYDGYEKYRTVIGDDCFIGCNTNLVAPVQLGDRVLTAAGSTVTEDVPDGAMAVARARQINKSGWNDARIDAHRSDK